MYYVRFRLPRDVGERLGLSHLQRSLETKELAQARVRCLAATIWFRETIDRLRLMPTLTRDDLEEAARRHFETLATTIDRPRDIPFDDWDREMDFQLSEARSRIEELEDQLRTNIFGAEVQASANQMLRATGGRLLELTEHLRVVALQLAARAERQQWRLYDHHLSSPALPFHPDDDVFNRRSSAVPTSLPLQLIELSPRTSRSREPSPTLAEATEEYSIRRQNLQLGASSIDEANRALGWLREQVGEDRPLSSITTDDIRTFRDNLSRLDVRFRGRDVTFAQRLTDIPDHQVKSVTAKKYWTSTQGFFQWAVDERKLLENPAAGIKLAQKRGERRSSPKPFDRSEIEAFFSTPLYTGHAGPKRLLDAGPHMTRGGKWWAGVLPFFTGLRAGELAQLLPEDFVFDHDIPHLKIREEDEAGRRVKTAKSRSSIRDVPIAPLLLALGLEEFVKSRSKIGQGKRIFYEFRLGSGGRKSEGMTRFWGDYLKAYNIWKPGRATHVARHTVASFLRASGVSDEEIGAVFGHAGRTVTSSYGEGMPLSRKAMIVDRLDYGLDFASLLGGPYDAHIHRV